MNPLEQYINFMQSVEDFDLDKLDEIVAEKIHFVDPFNDTIGITHYRRIIEDMRNQLTNLKIDVVEHAMVQGAVQNGIELVNSRALIRWRLSGNLKSFKNRFWEVEGCSSVSVNEQGRICEHLDYWDAAGQLYESFPLLGSLLRYVRRKLSVD